MEKRGGGGRGGEGREGSVYKTRTYIQVVKLCDSRDISRHSINRFLVTNFNRHFEYSFEMTSTVVELLKYGIVIT